jgi:2-C-methyl-D-erythritol 4-phosphate cytidylyltransferase
LKKFAIIVAGGSGTRMNSPLPKQFLHVRNKPIIVHTIERFFKAIPDIDLVAVLPKEHIDLFQSIKNEFLATQHITITEGGKTRFHSVQNGLNAILESKGKVLIHDAVRPMCTEKLIIELFNELNHHNAVIPVTKMKNSVRRLNPDGSSVAIDRNDYVQVQTPQAFDLAIIKKAYLQTYRETFTDDASIVEAMGESVQLVPGEENNFKITTPADLKMAELILRNKD